MTDGIDETELLRLAAAVERDSEHPLAEAVVAHADAAGAPAVLGRPASRTCPATARWPPSTAAGSRSATAA